MVDYFPREKVFSEEECKKIINSDMELITQDHKRANKTGNYPAYYLNEVDNTWVRERLEKVLFNINEEEYKFQYQGLIDYIGMKTYNVGDEFGWHTDTLIRTRRLACTIPLSMNCEGGDLEVFVGKKLTLNQRIGEAIVYPIWIYHRITPILSGKRISLVTWTIGDKI